MNRRFTYRTSGFSLVEVVVAIGLVSFALVSILAFFPTGLATNRSSVQETRGAQLARAVFGTIDSQSSTFGSVNCYGLNLDLTSLSTMSTTTSTNILYASYPSPNQPSISSTQTADSLYTLEMRFDNNPFVTSGVQLGAGKLSLIEIRVYGKARVEGQIEFHFLARNKG